MLGIQFAPWNIPRERRLQTLAVLFYTSMFLFWPFLFSFVLLALFCTRFYWLSLSYVLWVWYDLYVDRSSSRGGKRSHVLRRLKAWEYMRDYFPAKLVKTAELNPTKNYIMGYHPHGIISCGMFCNFMSEANRFSDVFGITPYPLTLKANFMWPVARGFTFWMGACDVSKESIRYLMEKNGAGNAAIIVIGGAEESLEAHPGTYNLKILNRKGFVKLAVKTGAHLVPIFTFGENDLFQQVSNPHGSWVRMFQEKFKQFAGFAPPFFRGRGIFQYNVGLLPYRKPITSVVGRPIEVTRDPLPDQATIDKYHQLYLDELLIIFDKHKSDHGISTDKKLHFI